MSSNIDSPQTELISEGPFYLFIYLFLAHIEKEPIILTISFLCKEGGHIYLQVHEKWLFFLILILIFKQIESITQR